MGADVKQNPESETDIGLIGADNRNLLFTEGSCYCMMDNRDLQGGKGRMDERFEQIQGAPWGMDGIPHGSWEQDSGIWKGQKWNPVSGRFEEHKSEGPPKKNTMALAAMAVGSLGLITSCCFMPGLVLGGLAVIFACLSRVERRMSSWALFGLVAGILGILSGLVFLAVWIFMEL